MEPVFHYILPILILLFFFPRLRTKLGTGKILLLGLIAVIPDIDCFLFGQHRFLFHNIFFVLTVFLIIYFLFGRLYGFLSLYFAGSHLLFDLAKPGSALLYPFTDKLFFLEIIARSANKWLLSIDFGFLDAAAIDPFYPHNYLQAWGALILILIGVMIAVKITRNIKRGKSSQS